VKNDGSAMLESMDIVRYVDTIGEPILTGPERPELTTLADGMAGKTAVLTWPRYPLLGLAEFATVAAHDHYIVRKQKSLGDLVEHRARTREYVRELMPILERLDGLIETPQAINGRLSMDDIRVLPLLRSAAVVKELRFPDKVRGYFETMMARTGHRPLPAI